MYRRQATATIGGGIAAIAGFPIATACEDDADPADCAVELAPVDPRYRCGDDETPILTLENRNHTPVGVIMYGPDTDDANSDRDSYTTTLDATDTSWQNERSITVFDGVPTGNYTIITRVLDEQRSMIDGTEGRVAEAQIDVTCPPERSAAGEYPPAYSGVPTPRVIGESVEFAFECLDPEDETVTMTLTNVTDERLYMTIDGAGIFDRVYLDPDQPVTLGGKHSEHPIVAGEYEIVIRALADGSPADTIRHTTISYDCAV